MIKESNKEYSAVYFVATGLIINERDEILLLKRSVGHSFPDYWQIPEGKVEIGENPQEAISRELKEETGLITKYIKNRFWQDCEFFHPGKGDIFFTRLIYTVKVKEAEVQISNEHSAFVWMKPEAAAKEKQLFPGVKEILDSLG